MDYSTLKTKISKRSETKLYAKLFKGCPHGLAQQSLEWSDVISPISLEKPYFIIILNQKDQTVLGGLPLYYFENKLGGILTSVPHAGPLGGVLCRQNLEEGLRKKVYKRLMEKAIDLSKELKCISLSIITNPFSQDAEFYYKPRQPDFIFNNFTQVIDLDTLFTDLGDYNTGKSMYNNDINRNLAKAKRAKVTVQWGEEGDFDCWYKIHCKRHREIEATPLPYPLLKGILSYMKPAEMGGLAVVKIKEQIVGGCFYIWNKKIADAFIMSGNSDFFEYGINYAVTDFAVRYFREHNIRWFNWQSCKRGSGVYSFKSRWGSHERSYQFLTWIFPGFEIVFTESAKTISKTYQWHYVAPFEAIKKKVSHGVFNKI